MASKKIAPAPEENKIVPAEPKAIVQSDIPDYLQEFRGTSTEEIDASDMTMPRVALCQDLTPQRKKNDPKHIPGLDSGQYFNTVTGEVYGEKIYFVPVKFSKAQMYCRPLNEGGGILCQSFNGKNGGKLHPESCETCPHNSWEEGKPQCGKLHNNLGYVFTEPPKEGDVPTDAAVLTFKSTSLKVGKQLNSLVRLSNLPRYCKVYEITAVDETRNQNTYAQHQLKPVGFAPKSIVMAGKELAEAMKDREIKVDDAGIEAEGGEGGTDFDTKDF